MALRAKVLQIKAAKFERKKLQVHKVIKEQVSALDPVLQDVYDNRRPKPSEYEVRRDLTRVFNEIAKEVFGNSNDIPVVVEFGSFVMDLFSTTSDLDLSVNFSTNEVFPREKKIQTLRKFAKKLYAIQSKGHVSGVLPITTAKVPILKCVDCGTGVECDISVENRDGIMKSQIIHLISSIDERFQKLSFLMKNWAKAHNINSSKDKTLNSLSIILLVAFHLQTRNPPILPPFSATFKDGSNPETVAKSLRNFVNYGKSNKESLAELFVTLLIKLSSVEKLWAKGLCASTWDGSWTSKTWDSKVACISVEDFTDRSQNVARAVGQAEVKQIHKCIDISLRYLFSFMNGQMARDRLRDLLFGQDGIPAPIPQNMQQIAGKGKKRKKQGMPINHLKIIPMASCSQSRQVESVSVKRMRVDDAWVAMPNTSWPPHVEVRVGHPTPFRQQPLMGWEGTQQTSGAGWGGTPQTSGTGLRGIQPTSGAGWGGTPQASGTGWGEIQPTSGAGWGGTKPTGGTGWGGTQQASGTGWGGAQQTSWPSLGGSGQSSHGGWGGTQQPIGRLGWNR